MNSSGFVSPDTLDLRVLCGGSRSTTFNLTSVMCRDDDDSDSEQGNLEMIPEAQVQGAPAVTVQKEPQQSKIINDDDDFEEEAALDLRREQQSPPIQTNRMEVDDTQFPPAVSHIFIDDEENDEAYYKPAVPSKRRRVIDEDSDESERSVVDLCSSDEQSDDEKNEILILDDSSDESVIQVNREYTTVGNDEFDFYSIVEHEDDEDAHHMNDGREDLLHPEFSDTFRSVQWLEATNISKINFRDLLVDPVSIDASLRRLSEARRKRQANEGNKKKGSKRTGTQKKKKKNAASSNANKKQCFQPPASNISTSFTTAAGVEIRPLAQARPVLAPTTVNSRPSSYTTSRPRTTTTTAGRKPRAKSTFDKAAYRRAHPLPSS